MASGPIAETSWNQRELVEWVRSDGSVIEVVTRAEMRARKLRHRATYVAVINSANELIVHQRADWKEVYPGWWDVAFGGVVTAGEEWLLSAERELAEEAGLSNQTLIFAGQFNYEADDSPVVGQVFFVRSDDEIVCADGEVVAIDKVPLSDLNSWLEGKNVCSDSRHGVVPLLLQGDTHAFGG